VDGILVANNGAAGWGLKAAEDLPRGRCVIRLPTSAHLSYGSDVSPQLQALIDKVPADLWGGKLALRLLQERVRGSDSTFAPYVRHLPRGVSGVPLFWGPKPVGLLEYPPVNQQVGRPPAAPVAAVRGLQKVQARNPPPWNLPPAVRPVQIKLRCRWLHEFATQTLAALPADLAADPFGGVAVDVNALGWALACVTSRAFRLRERRALLPLIDMADHSFEPNAEVRAEREAGTRATTLRSGCGVQRSSRLPLDRPCCPRGLCGQVIPLEGGAVGLAVKRDVAAGEALLLSYGPLSNDFLLLDYGFLVPGSPHDTVTLRFDVGLLQVRPGRRAARGAASCTPHTRSGAQSRAHCWHAGGGCGCDDHHVGTSLRGGPHNWAAPMMRLSIGAV
jgi:hypothetical protein